MRLHPLEPQGKVVEMRRAVLVLVVVALVLSLAALTAQAQDEVYTDDAEWQEESAAPEEQEVTSISVSGRAVVDLAQAISNSVAAMGAVPDWAPVTTSQGRQSISATDVFVLLNRTVYRWHADGEMPITVSVTLGAISPPVLDPQDFPYDEVDLEVGREIATDLFLSQAGECLRWMDEFQVVPTAVWVNGERLSASEYLAGLAICIEYAYYSGSLEDTIFLPSYSPPPAWVEYTELLSDSLGDQYPGGGEGAATNTSSSGYRLTPPVTPQKAVPRAVTPQLSLLPQAGSVVSGIVDLVASYSGPPAEFLTFAVDGQMKALTNSPPYSYRWDTSKLQPGAHEVKVSVFGEHAAEIIVRTSPYTIAVPRPEKAAALTAPKS